MQATRLMGWSSMIASSMLLATIGSQARGEDPVVLRSGSSSAGVLAFSPDGRRLATGAYHHDASRIWDLTKKTDATFLNFTTDTINVLAYSQDGALLVSVGTSQLPYRSRIVLSNGFTGDTMLDVNHQAVYCGAVSPDGMLLALGVCGSVELLQLPDCRTIGGLHEGGVFPIRVMAFSPDGRTLATNENSLVHIWDLAPSKPRKTLVAPGEVAAFAFARDSATLVAGCADGSLVSWNLADGSARWSVKNPGVGVLKVAISPNGERIAFVSRNAPARLLNAVTGEDMQTIAAGPGGIVESVAFAPDGQSLAVGSSNGVGIWRLDAGGKINDAAGTGANLRRTQPVRATLPSPSTAMLATPRGVR